MDRVAGPGSSATAIELWDITHRFQPSGFLAIDNLTLAVQAGEFMSIVGPSGCGKSTLLTLVAGLVTPAAGEVRVYGQRVGGVRRDTGFIFQRDALLPWRTARENVALALKFRGVPRGERNERADKWLARVGLKNLGDRFPHQLSGGQRKRVAIAATLVYEPQLLLMDEPFGALDVQTRDLLEQDVLAIWQESLASTSKQTVLFVTHDLEEAIALSDRVTVMSASPGRVLETFEVRLPRPRNIEQVRFDNEFARIHQNIWQHLRSEVLKAVERDLGG